MHALGDARFGGCTFRRMHVSGDARFGGCTFQEMHISGDAHFGGRTFRLEKEVDPMHIFHQYRTNAVLVNTTGTNDARENRKNCRFKSCIKRIPHLVTN